MAIRFYVRDWLSASAGVGLLKTLSQMGQEPDAIIEGNSLIFEEEDIKDRFPLALAKELTKDLNPESMGEKSLVEVAFARLQSLNDFYSNSPLSNPSSTKKKLAERSKDFEELFGSDPVGAVRELISSFARDVFIDLLGRKLSDRTCFFCGERKAYIRKGGPKTFEAVNFTPLSASTHTVENFFYNGKNNLYLCAPCEIVFYFAGFGFTRTAGNRYMFVYVPDIRETITLNSLLAEYKGINRDWLGKAVAEVLKETEKRKAEWVLENIYVVEIEKVSDATANIYSFSIPPRVARAIDDLSCKVSEDTQSCLQQVP
ncbi:MAG: type I-B CRISPR-associated protein Cas8b1/Cst1 [Aquificota bacterium]|nr:type I-B CRISPR-associated protein Cas8b1/Cst1 [Aquificota bacterium]